jgi:hypothetical protein
MLLSGKPGTCGAYFPRIITMQNGASANSTSEVSMKVMLVLLMVGN